MARAWCHTVLDRLTDLRKCSKGVLDAGRRTRMKNQLFFRSSGDRKIEHGDLAVGLAFQSRRVIAEQFATPPIPCDALGFQIGEPILINDRPHPLRRRLPKWVLGEKSHDV